MNLSMKNIILTLIMVFIAISTFSQAWLTYLPANKKETELTFFDYKAAFEQWCFKLKVDHEGFYINSRGEKQKAYGWKQFKRWEISMDGLYDRQTGRFLYDEMNREIVRYYRECEMNPRNLEGNWTSVAYSEEGSGNDGNGRINCIAFHPTDPDVFWVGTAWGGIWKTENHGASWIPLSDYIMTIGIGSIAIPSDYDQSHTIYLGTGDRGYNNDLGRGILKSTDGGQTWQPTGLSFETVQNFYINRLVFVPGTTDELIACTNEGIFKSDDGFQTWEPLLSCRGMDMEFHPFDANIIYVSSRIMAGKQSKIFRTINGGISWDTVLSVYGVRTELAVSPDEPTWVYAVVADTTDGLKGIYKSINSGATFGLVYDDMNILGGDCYGYDEGGQGNYDLAIAVNPLDANQVYVGAINIWKSSDGGNTWFINANGYHNCFVPTNVHVDIHWLDFQYLSDTLFVTNDGGIYFSPNNGTTYTNISGGLQINQPYRISCSQLSYDEILMGQQDNGVVLWSGGDVDFISGGDGGTSLINPMDDNNQFFAINNDKFYFTTNHWSDYHYFTTPGDYSGSYFKSIAIRPEDTVYYGGKDLWKSVEKGYNMTKIIDFADTTRIRRIVIAPTDGDIILVLNSEHLWRTNDGGANYYSLNLPTDVLPAKVIQIEISHTNPDVIWISLNDWGDGKGVYKSVNGGNTWSNISDGLPDCPIGDIIQNDLQTNYDELYASCYFGVYVKLGDNPWIPYSNGLPHVNPFDIDIYYNGTASKIRAGTHGRGIWESDLFSVDNSQGFVWTGNYNTDWNDYRNWNFMTVPSSTEDVIIPEGTPRFAHIYSNNANCRNLTIEEGGRLNITGKQLMVSDDLNIHDLLKFFGNSCKIVVNGNVSWKNGSSFEASDTACVIEVAGDWTFEAGSEADLTGTVVKFFDADFSHFYSNSPLSKFGRVVVNKPAPFSLSFEDSSSDDFVIMDDLIVNPNCKYYQNSTRALCVKGDLYAEGDFFQQNGSYRCKDNSSLKLFKSSSYFNDFFIDNNSLIFLLSDIKIRGNLDINSGDFRVDSYTVNLWGDLYKDSGGSFYMTTGRLVFSGVGEQNIWDNCEIKTVEINKISDTLRILVGRNVTFDNMDWTEGVISADGNSHLMIEELIDEGICGNYVVKINAILDIYNPTGSVDLNGKLIIRGGTVNVYGGNHGSYWPDAANAELQMTSGTLDFKDVGIFVRYHPSYTFTDNITGGVIRTSRDFMGDHTGFNPSGGVIELYGPDNAGLGHGVGSNFFKVVINKGSITDQPGYGGEDQKETASSEIYSQANVKPPSERPRYKKSPPPSGTRANKVTVYENLDINDQLVIQAGELDINGKTVDVASLVNIYGKLTMTNAASILNCGTSITWQPGSASGISEGLITLITSWQFMNGTHAALTGNNTVKVIGTGNSDIYHKDPDACFANFIADKTSGLVYLDNASAYPMRVNGNMTVKNGNSLRILTQDLIVNGTLLAENTSTMIIQNGGTIQSNNCTLKNTFNMVDGSTLSTNGMQLEGTLNLTDGGTISVNNFNHIGTLQINAGSVAIHNNYNQFDDGHLMLYGGSFIIDKPYSGAYFGFSGITDLFGGFFEISYESVKFDPGSVVNIFAGTFRVGGHFKAIEPDAFKPTYGAIEFINTTGSIIECNNGNYFYDLIINKNTGASPCSLAYATTVQNNLDIQSGQLNTSNNDLIVNENLVIQGQGVLNAGLSNIYVGDDWTNNRGADGFLEGVSTVYLISGQTSTISSETFYNLEMNKTTGFAQYIDLVAGSALDILNKFTLTDGSFRMQQNCILNLYGDLHIKYAAGLYANATYVGNFVNSYGNWLDENTTTNALIGFSSGQSTVNFKGDNVQEINAYGGATFFNLNLQKTGESFRPASNITVINDFTHTGGVWLNSTTGLTYDFMGDFIINDPSLWMDQTNTIAFSGESDQSLINYGAGWLNFSLMEVNRTGNFALYLASDISCANRMIINSGNVYLDNNRLMCQNGLDIYTTGNLEMLGDVTLYMGADASVRIDGGELKIWGSENARAHVSRASTGYYEFTVQGGGSLTASYTDFEFINYRGLQVATDGTIEGSLPFNYCSFMNGEAGGALLQVANNQDITLYNVDFPSNTWSGTSNVKKQTEVGNIYMQQATGNFAGPLYENDPNELIHWPSVGIWDGDISNEWHEARNWWYDYDYPNGSTDVIIPAGVSNFPVLSQTECYINSLTIENNASVLVQKDSLFVYEWVDNAGLIQIGDENGNISALFCDSIAWQAGSSAIFSDRGSLYISGNMFIRRSSNLNETSGAFRFYGDGDSRLICHDTARINNLYNDKSAAYSLLLEGDTLAKLTCRSFFNGAGTLKCPSSQEWEFLSAFRNTNNGHLRCGNGTISLKGSQSSYFRPNDGDYFNNLIVQTPALISLNSIYSDTLRINGDLVINQGTTGTSGIQANAFKIMIRGDWTNNVGTAAFPTGAGQTHQVVFCNPSERQEIIGNTNYLGVFVNNESEEGLHVYDLVNINNLVPATPVWFYGTHNVFSANFDDNFTEVHLDDGAVMQINTLNQGGVVHVHDGSLTVNDLGQNYVTGSYIIDDGLIVLNQAETTTTHDLFFADLTINGGELRFSGGNGQSRWPSTSINVSMITMTGGLFYLNGHNIEIMPGNFSENITGGTIRLPGNFIADAGVTSFHPTGGTVELYDNWDVDCGFLEPQCTFYNLYVNKSGGASVTPFYGMRIINELKLIQGYMQLYGNPVIVGP
jgi:photosystem II stability/assembly factor-like uncharacterized protein